MYKNLFLYNFPIFGIITKRRFFSDRIMYHHFVFNRTYSIKFNDPRFDCLCIICIKNIRSIRRMMQFNSISMYFRQSRESFKTLLTLILITSQHIFQGQFCQEVQNQILIHNNTKSNYSTQNTSVSSSL